MAKESKEIEEGKLFAFLGIFLTVIGFVIVLLTKKENKYAMYYAKQGLVLFFGYVAMAIVNLILVWIPYVGWILTTVLWLGLLVLWVIGIIYSLSGEEKPIPLIGQIAEKIKI